MTRVPRREQTCPELWVAVSLNKQLALLLRGHIRRALAAVVHQVFDQRFGKLLGNATLRGKGSGHLEVRGQREAPIPLQVMITASGNRPDRFRRAVAGVTLRLDELGGGAAKLWTVCEMSTPASKLLDGLAGRRWSRSV
jgi:hypothetical protein